MTFQFLSHLNVLILMILFSQFVINERKVEYKDAMVIINKNKIIISSGNVEHTWNFTASGLSTTGSKNQITGEEYAKIAGKYRCDWDLP
jgi:hypothetical protein